MICQHGRKNAVIPDIMLRLREIFNSCFRSRMICRRQRLPMTAPWQNRRPSLGRCGGDGRPFGARPRRCRRSWPGAVQQCCQLSLSCRVSERKEVADAGISGPAPPRAVRGNSLLTSATVHVYIHDSSTVITRTTSGARKIQMNSLLALPAVLYDAAAAGTEEL